MANFTEIAHKKVGGIPVIYLAGGAVVILAVVAWKLKSVNTGAVDTSTADDATATAGGLAPTPNPYDTLNPDGDGTVTVVQGQPTTDTSTTPVEKTNATWISEGTQWLVADKGVSGSLAQAALMKEVAGSQKSYDEQQWIDAWYKEGGPPPDGVEGIGTIGNKPATKQIPTLPGYHTVTGNADNTYGDIANLYYGHNEQATYDLVQAANVNKIGTGGPFAVGTKIYVPVYSQPVFYTVPSNVSSMPSKTIASKNGISVDQLTALNNNGKTSWPKNARVRVK